MIAFRRSSSRATDVGVLPLSFESLPLTIRVDLDGLRNTFVVAWEAGRHPSIENYLGARTEPERTGTETGTHLGTETGTHLVLTPMGAGPSGTLLIFRGTCPNE